MKVLILSLILSIANFLCKINAQTLQSCFHLDSIKATAIPVCQNKTTNLVFPYSVKSVDRGSADLLVQKAKGVENILQIKAAIDDFTETNLSVITGEGKLYSFTAYYNPTPTRLNFQVTPDSVSVNSPPVQSAIIVNEATMEKDAALIMQQPRIHFGIRDKKYKVKVLLKGIYIHEDMLYFQIKVANCSPIRYDIDMLHFFIKDRKQVLRTATQEIHIEPTRIFGNPTNIKSDSTQEIIFACQKFTIPDKKWLFIQLMEKNGGRHLMLKMGNRPLVRANVIHD